MKKSKSNFLFITFILSTLAISGCLKQKKKSRKKKSAIVLREERINTAFQKMVKGQKNDMLLVADPIKGKRLCSLCFACHNINKGEPSKGVSRKRIFVGPSLYGVYGRGIASKEDFEFSPAFKKHLGKTWTIQNLDDFLKRPALFAPGTKMKYPGVLDPQDRMDIIAYLMTITVE
jgi:cytochrome c2